MSNFSPQVRVFDVLDSTNDYLKKEAFRLENHAVIQALFQTHGRGRFEHLWESEKGQNLLFSILLKEPVALADLSPWLLYGLLRFLSKYGVHAVIKEPNDILVDGKKIAGILIERIYLGNEWQATILGVGLNINQTEFQSPSATSLRCVTDKHYDLVVLLEELLSELGKDYPGSTII